jgi:4-hydroxythreonine-4-phosphate dehydrogenase
MKVLPNIVITLGDPAGIGPEITCKAIVAPRLSSLCHPIVVGDIRFCEPFLKSKLKNSSPTFIDVPVTGFNRIQAGKQSKITGRAAYTWICHAVDMIQTGQADAMVTAPVSKAAINSAGIPFSGHTELLASLTQSRHYAMLMVAGHLRSVMVTRHLPLCCVGKKLSVAEIVTAAEQAYRFLIDYARIKKPKIVLCSLNPHAGEGGLLGKEEGSIIFPAVELLRSKGIEATGPLPADCVWQKAIRKEFDLVVTMYHDQTMIPLKCIAPEKIVNVTAGLPFIRTSPGHGTAFDIAGKNIADPRSMIEAICLAAHFHA